MFIRLFVSCSVRLFDHPYDSFIIWCRSESIESILCASLFPPEFPTKGRVKHWVTAVTHFDKVEMKALESILLQKQRSYFLSVDCSNWCWALSEYGSDTYLLLSLIIRLQQEMLKYMSLRQLSQVSVNFECIATSLCGRLGYLVNSICNAGRCPWSAKKNRWMFPEHVSLIQWPCKVWGELEHASSAERWQYLEIIH